MRGGCSSHYTLLLPNTSCSQPAAGPSTETPRTVEKQVFAEATWEGTCLPNTEEGEEGRAEVCREPYLVQKLLVGVLDGGGGGGGHGWPCTVATHGSSWLHSCLLFLSLSLSRPPPTPSSLSFLSSTQTLRGTIDPRLRSQRRRGISCPVCWGCRRGGGGGPRKAPHSQ